MPTMRSMPRVLSRPAAKRLSPSALSGSAADKEVERKLTVYRPAAAVQHQGPCPRGDAAHVSSDEVGRIENKASFSQPSALAGRKLRQRHAQELPAGVDRHHHNDERGQRRVKTIWQATPPASTQLPSRVRPSCGRLAAREDKPGHHPQVADRAGTDHAGRQLPGRPEDHRHDQGRNTRWHSTEAPQTSFSVSSLILLLEDSGSKQYSMLFTLGLKKSRPFAAVGVVQARGAKPRLCQTIFPDQVARVQPLLLTA